MTRRMKPRLYAASRVLREVLHTAGEVAFVVAGLGMLIAGLTLLFILLELATRVAA